MKTILFAAAIATLWAGAASAQYRGGDTVPMRDGSTIVTVGGCLVQYGARGQRINNAQRCNDDDMRRADQIMSGGGRPGYGGGPGSGGGPGYGGPGSGGGAPAGNWAQSCRGGQMRGSVFQTECRNSDGRWNSTVLDMRNCPSNIAENRNGSLVCR
jgi:hypothetical protein